MNRPTKGTGLPHAARADQGSLFETRAPGAANVGPATRASHPITSHRAATKAADKLTQKQLAVVDCMQRRRKPMTHEEIVIEYRERAAYGSAERFRRDETNWYPDLTDSSIRTRVKELATLGYVEKLDENGTSTRGNKATRWVLAFAGITLDVAKFRAVV